jgi:hypothetical protein
MNAALDRLLAQLDARGLRVLPGKSPGELLLSGPAAEKTPTVMEALAAFKPQLLERFATAFDRPAAIARMDELDAMCEAAGGVGERPDVAAAAEAVTAAVRAEDRRAFDAACDRMEAAVRAAGALSGAA